MTKSKFFSIMSVFFILVCSTYYFNKNKDMSVNRYPSSHGDEHYITSEQLKELGPIGLLKLLKEKCCVPVVIESISTESWIDEEVVEQLRTYIFSKKKASPIVSVNSSLPCFEEKYISSEGHEAKHLILSRKHGSFPISMCSTYDLPSDE